MSTKRVLVSGMGGELGSLVAARLEEEPWVASIVGLDVDPPRRRLRRSEFHLVDPLDRAAIDRVVRDADPEVIVHFAVYEPNARASTREAAQWTPSFADAVFTAAAECASLERIVVRSGTELYGRGRRRPDRPDESAPVAPTTPFGRELADVEARARLIGHQSDVPVTALRLASVLGPHVPSPLGRLLRLPVVPVDLRGLAADARFDVIDDRDAARTTVAAAAAGPDGALNVAAPDPYPVRTILRHARRLAVPVVGPNWWGAGAAANLAGAPVPPHVRELLTLGRTVDASAVVELLGVAPVWSSPQVIEALFDWADVVHVKPGGVSDFVAVEGS